MELRFDIQDPRLKDDLPEPSDGADGVDLSEVVRDIIPGLFRGLRSRGELRGGVCCVGPSGITCELFADGVGGVGGWTGSPPCEEVLGGTSFASPGELGAWLRW